MLNRIHSFQSVLFESFDELVDYIDNLGDDSIFITRVRGYTPVIFLEKNISSTDYKNIEYPGFYKQPDKHDFRQITYRAKDPGYELSIPSFKEAGACPCYPYMHIIQHTPGVKIFNVNQSHEGIQAFDLGNEYMQETNEDKITYQKYGFKSSLRTHSVISIKCRNYFKMANEFRMAGFPFAYVHDLTKVGFDYYFVREEEAWELEPVKDNVYDEKAKNRILHI